VHANPASELETWGQEPWKGEYGEFGSGGTEPLMTDCSWQKDNRKKRPARRPETLDVHSVSQIEPHPFHGQKWGVATRELVQ